MIKHSGHLRTLEKCRKHSPAARVLYISLVFSNDHRVGVYHSVIVFLQLFNRILFCNWTRPSTCDAKKQWLLSIPHWQDTTDWIRPCVKCQEEPFLKPWSNGLASRRKLKTLVYLRLRVSRALRWIALTLVEIKSASKSKQVFHRLATQPGQVNASWETSINLSLANEM